MYPQKYFTLNFSINEIFSVKKFPNYSNMPNKPKNHTSNLFITCYLNQCCDFDVSNSIYLRTNSKLNLNLNIWYICLSLKYDTDIHSRYYIFNFSAEINNQVFGLFICNGYI